MRGFFFSSSICIWHPYIDYIYYIYYLIELKIIWVQAASLKAWICVCVCVCVHACVRACVLSSITSPIRSQQVKT